MPPILFVKSLKVFLLSISKFLFLYPDLWYQISNTSKLGSQQKTCDVMKKIKSFQQIVASNGLNEDNVK